MKRNASKRERLEQLRLKQEKRERTEQEERERLKKLHLEHKEQEHTAWEAKEEQYKKEQLCLELEDSEREQLCLELEDSEREQDRNKKRKEIENCTSFDLDFDHQVDVFDRNNTSFVSSFVPACSDGKSFESSFDRQAVVFDRNQKLAYPNLTPGVLFDDNGKIFELDLDRQVAVFDRDNPGIFHGIVGTILQQIGAFDRDNPKVNDTDPLNRMGNVLPLIGPRKNTGNRISVPNPSLDKQAFVLHADNVFDRDNPYLTIDSSKSLFYCLIQLKKHEEGPFDSSSNFNYKYHFCDRPTRALAPALIDLEQLETKDALDIFEQDFDNDIYIVFHDNNDGNIFAFPDNTDPLDNLEVLNIDFKRISVFDRDNPKVKATDPLSRMWNVFPLISPWNGTGN